MTFKPDRRMLLAKIHIAKKDLGMEDDDYRALLSRVTGKSSSKDLKESQMIELLDEMKKLGFKGAPGKGVKRSDPEDDPQARKIRAMWLTLHQMGEVQDGGEESLRKFCKRVAGIDHLKWLSGKEADEIIKALRGWIKRKGGDPNAY